MNVANLLKSNSYPYVQYGPVNQDKYEECSNKRDSDRDNISNLERCGSINSNFSPLCSDVAVEDVNSSNDTCNLITYLDSARDISPIRTYPKNGN